MVRPASRQISTRRVASLTSISPQALKNSFFPPNVPVPNVRTGTLNPDLPSNRYSIIDRLCSIVFEPHTQNNRTGKCHCWLLELLACIETPLCLSRSRSQVRPVSSGHAEPGRLTLGKHSLRFAIEPGGDVFYNLLKSVRVSILGDIPNVRSRQDIRQKPKWMI